MKAWQFKQPTPGFGIRKDAYLSVLAGTAQLPPITAVVHPNMEGGAIEGMGAPLAAGATKADLDRPMARGGYVIASKDRKTVLKLLVVSKEEAGYDPSAILQSSLANVLSREVLDRVSATWSLFQLTFESHHPMVYDSVRFQLSIAKRLAELTQGVVADPISQSFKLPAEVFRQPQLDPKIDVRDVVAVHRALSPAGANLFTHGMRKFGMAEIEIPDVPVEAEQAAAALLVALGQNRLLGKKLDAGDQVGTPPLMMDVVEGGADRSRWEGIPVLDILPPKQATISAALMNWFGAQR